VIGDSITCGYGDLGTDPSCHFSPATEDHYLSYGRLLSDRLDADLSTVAWSGRGVVKNYDGEIAPLMPELYPRVLPQDAGSRWSFQRPADYVVINLGTNDFSTEPDPSLETFASEYEKLLRLVRDKNPGARIIATVGPMLMPADRARAEAAIQKAVAARVAMGDVEVAFHHLEAENQKPGCDYHPGLRTHRAMAEELWDVFRAKPSGGKVTRDQISAR
jgi:lysophospholipase L1-like esterase